MANTRISIFGICDVSNFQRNPKLRWWLCFNALAVDTVLISLFWQSLVAKLFEIELEHCHRILLGAAVWLGYIADRVSDGFQITNRACSVRHYIAFRYSRILFFSWIFILFLTVLYSVHAVPLNMLSSCMFLAVLCMLNSLVNTLDKFGRFLVPKELRTALLFASGVFLFIVLELPDFTIWLWITFFSFACLCFANCCYFASWDRKVDLIQGQSSLILRGNFSLDSLRFISLFMAFGFIFSSFFVSKNLNPFFTSTGLAMLSLPLIDILVNESEYKRLLAELGLLLSTGCVFL